MPTKKPGTRRTNTNRTGGAKKQNRMVVKPKKQTKSLRSSPASAAEKRAISRAAAADAKAGKITRGQANSIAADNKAPKPSRKRKPSRPAKSAASKPARSSSARKGTQGKTTKPSTRRSNPNRLKSRSTRAPAASTTKPTQAAKPAKVTKAQATKAIKAMKPGLTKEAFKKLAQRAGILGLGMTVLWGLYQNAKLTDRDVKFGRRTQQVQREAAAKAAKDKKPNQRRTNTNRTSGAKKEQPKAEKGVVIEVSRPSHWDKPKAANKPKTKPKVADKPKTKPKPAPKPKTKQKQRNVLRDRYGQVVTDSRGKAIKTTDWDSLTQDQIDEMYNF